MSLAQRRRMVDREHPSSPDTVVGMAISYELRKNNILDQPIC